MSLKDKWIDKIDGVDDVLADDINSIARAVISTEEQLLGVSDALDAIIAIQDKLIGVSFFVDGVRYPFDRGMTWGEWMNSSYNTIGLQRAGIAVLFPDGCEIMLDDGMYFDITDVIIPNGHYIHDGAGARHEEGVML